MLKIIQSFLFVLIVHFFANIVFAFFTIIFNLDLNIVFSSYSVAFTIQNILILFVYLLLTLLLGWYFKNSYRYPFKARIIGLLLLTCYLICFYLSINNNNLFKYFLYIHYPIGSLFRTIILSQFTLNVKISIILSVISASLGVYFGHKINVFIMRLKKRKLSSVTKKG